MFRFGWLIFGSRAVSSVFYLSFSLFAVLLFRFFSPINMLSFLRRILRRTNLRILVLSVISIHHCTFIICVTVLITHLYQKVCAWLGTFTFPINIIDSMYRHLGRSIQRGIDWNWVRSEWIACKMWCYWVYAFGKMLFCGYSGNDGLISRIYKKKWIYISPLSIRIATI